MFAVRSPPTLRRALSWKWFNLLILYQTSTPSPDRTPTVLLCVQSVLRMVPKELQQDFERVRGQSSHQPDSQIYLSINMSLLHFLIF